MSTDRETTRIVRSWLEEGVTALPDRVLDAVIDQVPATSQRRPLWRAWRFQQVTNPIRYAIAAAAVLTVALVGYQFLPSSDVASRPTAGPTPTPQASPSMRPEPSASLVTHVLTPFGPSGDDPADPLAASMTFTFDAPASWTPFGRAGMLNDGQDWPDVAAMFFYRGGDLYSDPCRAPNDEAVADVPVGPTVDDFVSALVDHPSLDVTSPVDVTLAGYSGKYLDVTIPDDISDCDRYRPLYTGHVYAQGPGQRWHMWVLDVDGIRVLVETNDYAGTPPQRLAEMQAILDSLEITP